MCPAQNQEGGRRRVSQVGGPVGTLPGSARWSAFDLRCRSVRAVSTIRRGRRLASSEGERLEVRLDVLPVVRVRDLRDFGAPELDVAARLGQLAGREMGAGERLVRPREVPVLHLLAVALNEEQAAARVMERTLRLPGG